MKMIKNATSVIDDRGYNQGFKETYALQKRMERRAGWMIQEMEAGSKKKLLEIGCGTGFLSYFIAQKTGMHVLGSDLCVPFIEEAKAKYSLSNLSYDTLDFNKAAGNIDNKFDYIIGNGILHHLYYNMDEVLFNLKVLLNTRGKIIFMEPNIYNPYVATIFKNKTLRRWANLEPDEMAFSADFIKKKLASKQFSNIKIEYKDFLLPGIPRIMVSPSIKIGNVLEKTLVKFISQSILIIATKD
ncbi:MAG: methyltransferase domain-containing protein [Ferruginibacter sp.]